MPEQSNDYRVVVFGAGGVGKSSLVLRFLKGTYSDAYVPTVEDTYREVITANANLYTLYITDTTGSHQFPAMQRLNISKGQAFVLVFSVTAKLSLEELAPVFALIKEVKVNLEGIPMMLVGNKSDEETSREVSYQDGLSQSQKWGCNFMETSAKNNDNVKEMFQELLNMEKSRNVSLQSERRSLATKVKGKCLLM